MTPELLKELGLDKASAKVEKKVTLKKKLAIAYEHFRFVEPHIFERFAAELKVKTKRILENCPKCHGKGKMKEQFDLTDLSTLSQQMKHCYYCQGTGARRMTEDTLIFMKLADYPEVPPPDCLLDLKKAKDMQCFDEFEVAKVETIESRPDPIIFGLINGCQDKFFITQWDDDVSIEEILKKNEG